MVVDDEQKRSAQRPSEAIAGSGGALVGRAESTVDHTSMFSEEELLRESEPKVERSTAPGGLSAQVAFEQTAARATAARATAARPTASRPTASGATTSGATTSGATTSGATTSGATTSGATTSGATASGATTSGATVKTVSDSRGYPTDRVRFRVAPRWTHWAALLSVAALLGVGLSSGAALLLARNATQGPILRKTRVTIIATWQTKDRVVYRLRVRSPRAAMSVGAFLRLETPRGLSRPLFWANSSGQGEATMITVVFTRLLGQAAAAGRLFLIDTKGGYQTLQPEG